MYKKQTNSILITVKPEYREMKSSLFEGVYVWSYHVNIQNLSDNKVQLLGRHWKIVDSYGMQKEVVGEGVVGLKPIIEPGDKFEYASETTLSTPSGIMFGQYKMLDTKGEIFDVEIPAFSLDSPHANATIN